eukprot:3696844-Lingulodinium_polyedra.AAC.1
MSPSSSARTDASKPTTFSEMASRTGLRRKRQHQAKRNPTRGWARPKRLFPLIRLQGMRGDPLMSTSAAGIRHWP